MWVAVVGSRTLVDDDCPAGQPHPEDTCVMLKGWLEVLKAMTRAASKPGFEGFVSGGAKGVDTWAEDVAGKLGEKIHIYRPESEKGKTFAARAYARNSRIVKQADMILAFYDPRRMKSPGTGDTVAKAQKAGREVHVWSGRWEQ